LEPAQPSTLGGLLSGSPVDLYERRLRKRSESCPVGRVKGTQTSDSSGKVVSWISPPSASCIRTLAPSAGGGSAGRAAAPASSGRGLYGA
jgi:hypothetical protein